MTFASVTLPGLVVMITGLAAAPAARAERPPPIEPRQALATLLEAHTAFARPSARSARVRRVAAARPITGTRTVLPVLRRTTTRSGQWLRVRLPGRPNGAKGWIRARGTEPGSTPWHIVVDTSARRVRVYRGGSYIRFFSAIVGTPATPTPHGRFFVEESVRMLPGSAGAPFALALSARSNVLQEFAGGPGQTAIHGVGNIGGTLGTAASHGCIRLGNPGITWLAARIDVGAPVTIRR
jgi:hypothetical protein